MEVANCPRCGKIFQKVNVNICQNCIKQEEVDFEHVKKYIEENPMCQLGEVSKETGVSANRILRYVKEGRLEISKGMEGEVTCESCGKPVTRGKFCEKCVIEINNTVSDMFSKNPTDEVKRTGKMHISHKRI